MACIHKKLPFIVIYNLKTAFNLTLDPLQLVGVHENVIWKICNPKNKTIIRGICYRISFFIQLKWRCCYSISIGKGSPTRLYFPISVARKELSSFVEIKEMYYYYSNETHSYNDILIDSKELRKNYTNHALVHFKATTRLPTWDLPLHTESRTDGPRSCLQETNEKAHPNHPLNRGNTILLDAVRNRS